MKRLSRGAGILLAITSLPSPYGIGTLGDAAFRFIDLLVDLKQSYWQVLPVGPTGYGNSPYQPNSAFAGNPYLIDLDILMREGLLKEAEINAFCWGEEEQEVDYEAIYKNRMQVLRIAYERFNTADEPFIEFMECTAFWLDDYAMFAALKAHFKDHAWKTWDQALKDREPQALAEYEALLCEEVLFYKFCQYEFFKQWGNLKNYAKCRGIQLIGDLPFYISADSADAWVNRELFQLKEDCTPKGMAGFPPDIFSQEGQKWGSPVYDWNRMEEDGFAWWQARIVEYAAMFDVIRLNHFTGFVKYYTIPNKAKDGKNGKWSKGPGKKLVDVIEHVIGDTGIIAEDIGPKTPVPGVKRLMARTGWPGVRVLMFAFNEDTANEHLPHNYTDCNLVVYAGTHDTETIAGYFRDKTDYELAYLYEYLNIKQKRELPDALIRAAYASIADVVIIQMQDLMKLGNEARMNTPSTVGKNWSFRIGEDSLSEEWRAWIRTLAALYRR